MPIRLAEITQPLFQYVCLLNRSARYGRSYDLNQVQSELNALFAEMSAKSRPDELLRLRYRKVEPVLLFFVDEMIRKSDLSFARDWKDLAVERGFPDGDEKFFDMMDVALSDSGPGVVEELGVYYTCLGLGFVGWYAGQADHLRKRMLELSARIRGMSDADQASRIVPEAYEHVDTSDLIESPGASVAGIVIGLVGLTIVLLLANFYFYHMSFRKLDGSLERIIRGDGAATTAPASPAQSSDVQPNRFDNFSGGTDIRVCRGTMSGGVPASRIGPLLGEFPDLARPLDGRVRPHSRARDRQECLSLLIPDYKAL